MMPRLLALNFVPPVASEGAAQIDHLLIGLVCITGFFALLVMVLIVVFGIKYRAGSPADRSQRKHNSVKLEVAWIGIPVLLMLCLFVWAGVLFFKLTQPPADARTVYVVAKQWMWKFQHPEGPQEINVLHVPIGAPIKLVLRSQDVVHSFFVPAFRVKQDVLPNRYTATWFRATQTGTFRLECSQFCGTDHSAMKGYVIVMRPEDYERWLSSGTAPMVAPVPGTPGTPEAPLAVGGRSAFFRFGCNACHTPDADVRAPRLDGLYGRQVRLRNGEIITADEDYLRESILYPNAKIVAGYDSPSLMPTYVGQVSDRDLQELIEFIKSIQTGWPEQVVPPAPAAAPATSAPASAPQRETQTP